jgi:uncharacterized protein YndB with AHSA1/START domain
MSATVTSLPVRKTVVVRVPPADAFAVFTEEVDTWWPRTHHIGKSPMRRIRIEGAAGGRCYTEHEDGSEADWGRVLAWEPPGRLVLAWQVTHEWGPQPDLAKASEVEVRFMPVGADATRVEIEHRFLERHGAGAAAMRAAVDGPNGWPGMCDLYAARVAARGSPHT